MNMLRRTLETHALALLLGSVTVIGGAACDSGKVVGTGTGGTTGLGGAPAAAGGAGGSTTGAGGAGGTGIPLVEWVTDLTDHHTDEVSPPDTVADKNIIDTDNPGAFDPLLAP
jgi:hypothetical protein